MINLILPEDNAEVSILTEQCKFFYESEEIRKVTTDESNDFRWDNPQMVNGEDYSRPLPVKMTWEDNIKELGLYVVIVSENKDLSNPIVRVTESNKIDFYNLCVGIRYYWCVQKEAYRSEIHTFTVKADSPRLIYIDGLNNVRDIGGQYVPNGRIRQKMIYRGCELEGELMITEKGLADFLRLGIKTKIDLKEYYKSSVTDMYGINNVNLTIEPYLQIFNPEYITGYRAILLKLIDKNIYPVYMHCIAGADRTGTIIFILEALLGMSEKDLFDEYELTSLSRWGKRTRNHINFVNMRKKLKETYGGNTINESVENYVLNCLKLTPEQIKTIRNLMIEKNS